MVKADGVVSRNFKKKIMPVSALDLQPYQGTMPVFRVGLGGGGVEGGTSPTLENWGYVPPLGQIESTKKRATPGPLTLFLLGGGVNLTPPL